MLLPGWQVVHQCSKINNQDDLLDLSDIWGKINKIRVKMRRCEDNVILDLVPLARWLHYNHQYRFLGHQREHRRVLYFVTQFLFLSVSFNPPFPLMTLFTSSWTRSLKLSLFDDQFFLLSLFIYSPLFRFPEDSKRWNSIGVVELEIIRSHFIPSFLWYVPMTRVPPILYFSLSIL